MEKKKYTVEAMGDGKVHVIQSDELLNVGDIINVIDEYLETNKALVFNVIEND